MTGCHLTCAVHIMGSDIHRCISSDCDRPRRAIFPVLPARARRSSLSSLRSALSWNDPSGRKWQAGCSRPHTGLPSLCLLCRSRNLWMRVSCVWHSLWARRSGWCLEVWPGSLPVRCSPHWPHGSAWPAQKAGNTSCGLWCHAGKLKHKNTFTHALQCEYQIISDKYIAIVYLCIKHFYCYILIRHISFLPMC